MPTLSTIAQGSERPTVVLTWTHADGTTGEDLTNAALTGYVKDLTTGEVRAILGTIEATDAAAGIIEWTPDPFDVASEGAYQVQFNAVWPGEPTPGLTAVFDWEIAESIIPTDDPGSYPDYQGVVKLLIRTTDPDPAIEGYIGLWAKADGLYLTDEDGVTQGPFSDGSAAVAAHVLESDPHTGYLTEASAATIYSPTAHTHDYAASGHNHNSDYISIIPTPTEGNLPTITSGGELANSAYAPSSFAASAHTHDYAASGHAHDAAYISVIATPTEGNIPTITSGGELANSAYAPSSFAASGHTHTDIPLATIDAKGDLIVGTADNTVTRLAVGTDTHILTADSAQATGVKWAAPAPTYTDEQARDAAAAIVTGATHDGVSVVYTDDGTNAGTLAITNTDKGSTAVSTHVGLADPHSQYLTETQYADIYRQGFTNLTETTIAFDGTNLFTLASAGASWTYYRAGVKYTITGNKTVTLPGTPVATGHWHIYIDATDGTLTASLTDWTLLDSKVPVASLQFNNALTPKYWLADERHTVLIDQRMQYYLHASQGAQLVTTPSLTGYTPNSDSDTAHTFAISACALLDQDIRTEVASLADPNGTDANYSVWYRTTSTAWAWQASAMPFPYAAAGYIQYDNGGTLTEGIGSPGRYYNSYLLVTNLSGAARYIFIPGRATFTTLAAAQVEDVADFTWGSFDIDEVVIAYRLTWETSNAYSSKGKCRLAANPQVLRITTSTNASSGAGTDHNTLSNLQGSGVVNEYYHLNATDYADLTDGGATTLHTHNYIAPTIIDAKGDLIVGTAADTPARLAAGTDTYILIADSAQTEGVKWGVNAPTWTNVTDKPSIYQSTLFLNATAADVGSYKTALTNPATGTEATATASASSGTGEVLIAGFITPVMGVSVINGNAWSFKTFAKVDSTTGVSQIVARVYKRTQGGTETQLFTDLTAEINATSPAQFDINSVQGAFTCDATDRMVIKYYAKTTSAGARTFTLYYQGTERYSHVSTPVLFASLTVATDTIWDAKGDIAVGTGADAAVVLPVGTDTHVLTANSAATNGVEWAVIPDQGGILKSLIDAKGDLIVGSVDNTAARLAVGTNTYVLTANSAATNGVEWAASAAGHTDEQIQDLAAGLFTSATHSGASVSYNDGAATVAITVADQGGILKSLLDAKGDLVVASAADTPAKLAVGGTNGHVLTVDSGEATGVKWAAVTIPTGSITRYLTLGRAGTLTATAGTARLYVPFACTITNIRASVGTAPTGASLIVDVNLDGVTLFTTQGNRPTITATNFTDLTNVPDVTSISANSYLTVDVDQIGSTIAGAELCVIVEVTA